MENRREFLRVHHAIKIKYQVHKNPLWEGGDSEDISSGGIRFLVSRRFPPGVTLKLQIFIPERSHPIAALGEVIWRSESGNKKSPFEIGLKFISIDIYEQRELVAYIQKVSRKKSDGS